MNKRLKIIILLGVIVIGTLSFSKPIFNAFKNTDTIINKIGCRLFELNRISVKSNDNIDLSKIQIKIDDEIVFKDGKQKNRVGQAYGITRLNIYYGELLIAEVGHWKRNNWYTNDYEFELSKKGNNFIVNHKIFGPDSKNDNFQKRYIYNELNNLIRIDYLNEQNELYNTE